MMRTAHFGGQCPGGHCEVGRSWQVLSASHPPTGHCLWATLKGATESLLGRALEVTAPSWPQSGLACRCSEVADQELLFKSLKNSSL